MTATKATALSYEGLKPSVVKIAEALRKEAKVDHTTGTTTIADQIGVYARLVQEANPVFTPEAMGDLDEFHADLAAAGYLVNGELGLDAMKKHKELDRVSLTIPASGKNHFDFQFNRSSQVPDRNVDGTAGVKEKFGTGTMGFSMYATKPNGNLGKVKKMLSEHAHKVLVDNN